MANPGAGDYSNKSASRAWSVWCPIPGTGLKALFFLFGVFAAVWVLVVCGRNEITRRDAFSD